MRLRLPKHVGEPARSEKMTPSSHGAHQRRPRQHFATQRSPPPSARALDHRPQREREVRARVAVGNWIDVEVVDPLPVRLQVLERCAR
jgi:hypothetical protein